MNEAGIKGAIREAEIFVKAGILALGNHQTNRKDDGKYTPLSPGKVSAACRRASMDLTRALAEMRKP